MSGHMLPTLPALNAHEKTKVTAGHLSVYGREGGPSVRRMKRVLDFSPIVYSVSYFLTKSQPT